MLEIRNVNKTYRPKKGVPVKALDDVSIKFESTGMVFILGKSGSGKSTLLNVLGGLDKADSGEFIIKGKSSNDFTQSDFDSYRNTFIGFIFQEYNILPDFTVGANIALAMELQGKKATDEALNEILTEVDLVGYGNRKPNELSGGQKQRVAIARALIKQPEMIMADEPTGALDSNTGKQVFDTLKKLSKTKLVLIVSHDRDFAELYADRIIELKDGKIISDVSKSSVDPDSVSEGVSIIDDKIIRIKKGYKLTAKDLKLINGYLERGGEEDTIISLDGKKNPEIKKTLKINDEGGKDEFKDTRPEDVKLKDYTPEDSKLIRSRLPYKNSLKIGASSLKAKPGRLVFTILLSMIAFALFGLADTMSAYDKITTYEQSIIDSRIEGAAFVKKKVRNDYGYEWKESAQLSDKDIAVIGKDSGVNVTAVYNGQLYDNETSGISIFSNIADSSKLTSPNGINFYAGVASGFAEITENELKAAGCRLDAGRMPATDGEIAITTYIYEHFKLGGLSIANPDDSKAKPETVTVRKPEDVLDKYITIKNANYKIVGVVDTGFDSSKYADFKPDGKVISDAMSEMFLYAEMQTKTKYSYHSLIIVAKGSLNKIVETVSRENLPAAGERIMNWLAIENGTAGNDRYGRQDAYSVATLSRMTDRDAIVWTDDEKTSLAENEIILPLCLKDDETERTVSDETVNMLTQALGGMELPYRGTVSSATFEGQSIGNAVYIASECAVQKYITGEGANDINNPELKSVLVQYWLDNYESENFDSNNLSEDWYRRQYAEWLLNGEYDKGNGKLSIGGYISNAYGKAGYLIERPYKKEIYKLEGIANRGPAYGKISYWSDADRETKTIDNFKIVGYFMPGENTVMQYENGTRSLNEDSNMFVVADSIFAEVISDKGVYAFAIGVMPYSDHAAVSKIVNFNYTEHEGGVYYSLKNEVSDMLDFVDELVVMLARVFLYVGIFFAVFASLMMYNFISVSINYKKREIGILRAVGARSSDVFGIFFNESMIITIINFVLSSILTFGVVGAINGMLRNNYGFALTLLTVGIRQFALILGVGVLVAFIGSFLPVMRIARKRPIDAIQNR